MIKSFVRSAKHAFGLDYVKFHDLFLPILRTNQGLKDNEAYLASGGDQVEFIKKEGILKNDTAMLDFGCGQGRIANCIHKAGTYPKTYVGVDTDKYSIEWCSKYIGSYEKNFKFIHVPAYNARYNKSASGLKPLPFDDGAFNLIFLNSVFSHMLADDIRFYLKEFNRLLDMGGKVYLTAFVEENVPDESENPDNYLQESTGALHRVRFEKEFIFNLFKSSGFEVERFLHQHIDRTKQSVVILTKL